MPVHNICPNYTVRWHMPGTPLDPRRRTNRYLRLSIAASLLIGILLLVFLWRYCLRNPWAFVALIFWEVMFTILPVWECVAELRRRKNPSKREIIP